MVLLWIFETRIVILIMMDKHQYRDSEEGRMIYYVHELIAQLYMGLIIFQ